MEVLRNSYGPGDPSLIDRIVCELKSQGIFDEFRKECIADVDTKPAYQNLRQRVEGSVSSFLRKQSWKPDMNKNQVREMLRKSIHESGFLETGVERIVDQVVNPKINTIFLPQVEDVVYRYLGIEKPQRDETKNVTNPLKINVMESLLPTDLEAISPDSDLHDDELDAPIKEESEKAVNVESENTQDDLNDSKMDEDESPPFEPLEETVTLMAPEENSVDSHLSGFSGVVSHDSNQSREPKIDVANQDSQMSKHSSEEQMSISASDNEAKSNAKFEFSQDSQSNSDKSVGKVDEKKEHKSSSSGGKHKSSRSEKERDREKRPESKDKKERHSSSKDVKSGSSSKDKKESRSSSSSKHESRSEKEHDKDKSKSKSSTSRHSSSSREKSGKKERSSDKDKSKTLSSKDAKPKDKGDGKSSHSSSSKHKKDEKSKHSSSSSHHKDKRDTKKDSKPKDDHFSSKHKKHDRRSKDRDSNDGQSSQKSTSTTTQNTTTTQPQKSSSQESSGSNSGSVDSGTSETDAAEKANQTAADFTRIKIIKPKFASNIHEAKRLIKIRKELDRLEKGMDSSLLLIKPSKSGGNGLLEAVSLDEGEEKSTAMEVVDEVKNDLVDSAQIETIETQKKVEIEEEKTVPSVEKMEPEEQSTDPLESSIEENQQQTQPEQVDFKFAGTTPPETERFLEYATNEMQRLEEYLAPATDDDNKTEDSVVAPETPSKKRKRTVDARNNNKKDNNNVEVADEGGVVKKLRKVGGGGGGAAATVTVLNDNFSLPLSPAESEKSVERVGRRQSFPSKATQRYSSEDLYKPRLCFSSSRRRNRKTETD